MKVGHPAVGKILVLIGIAVVAAGFIMMAIERFTDGRGLPGDIHIRRDGITILIPIATMILLSLILTLILNFLVRK